jgi:hypothetical protein
MKLIRLLLVLIFPLFSMGCHWFEKDDPTPLEQLPAATQTGANTFGCLLNGQAWTPKGRIGLVSNFFLDYDPTYRKGTLSVAGYRYLKNDASDVQDIGLGSDSITAPGTYPLEDSIHQTVIFLDRKTGCEYLQIGTPFRSGTLTITKLDMTKRIISGTFEFTIFKPGCDTIRATDGRFDGKF